MNKGDTVFQLYGGIHRYGKVIEKKENLNGDGWAWFKVNWVGDEKYTTSQRWKAKMRGEDSNHFLAEYYRADDVQKIDLNNTLMKLLALQND